MKNVVRISSSIRGTRKSNQGKKNQIVVWDPSYDQNFAEHKRRKESSVLWLSRLSKLKYSL